MKIRVYLRIRPFAKDDGSVEACLISDPTHPSSIRCFNQNHTSSETFDFDSIFDNKTLQKDVFEEVKDIVDSVIRKANNGTIMSYGQTSSGKTHTLFGNLSKDNHLDWGLVPRTISYVYQEIQSQGDPHGAAKWKVRLSLIEVYNEQIRDLLSSSTTNLSVLQTSEGIHIQGLTAHHANNTQECLDRVKQGMENRSTGSTAMNERSSRSHCVVMLSVTDPAGKESKLCLVDLAGSERQKKTLVQGAALQEGQNINKSLLVLSSVVNALSDGKPNARVPYRDSKLTRILQDSLGGSAMTAIIICVSPCQAHHSETLSTLRFGARARAIEIKMQSNKTPKPVSALIQQDPSSHDAAPHRAYISPVKFALTWFFISLVQGLGITIILGLHSIPPGKLSP